LWDVGLSGVLDTSIDLGLGSPDLGLAETTVIHG